MTKKSPYTWVLCGITVAISGDERILSISCMLSKSETSYAAMYAPLCSSVVNKVFPSIYLASELSRNKL